jgi:hypothetical protein
MFRAMKSPHHFSILTSWRNFTCKSLIIMISGLQMPHSIATQRPQPWKPADATDAIRHIAKLDDMMLDLTGHARSQMVARDLILGDVLHVLKHGFVYEEPEPATREGCYKYKVETTSPSSARVVRVVAIPWVNPLEIKIVTVMWRDEAMQ